MPLRNTSGASLPSTFISARRQQRTGALSLQDGASVQVAFVADTRTSECTTLRRRFVTRFPEIVSVMMDSFTVGGVYPRLLRQTGLLSSPAIASR